MKTIAFLLTVVLFSGLIAFIRKKCGLHFIELEWAIGIYRGASLYQFIQTQEINNPVLSAKDITDIKAEFIADPFMIREKDQWYMFFEALNKADGLGDIGLAMSGDGMKWTYQQIVLSEPFHLSYPYIFKHNNEYYMIPESGQILETRLYKAVHFPLEWTFAGTLLKGAFFDSSIFLYESKWWMFSSSAKKKTMPCDTLHLFYADHLLGPWRKHPKSPIVIDNPHAARSAGRVLVEDGKIIRYAQDDYPKYGKQVIAFEVSELSTVNYCERKVEMNPVLKQSGRGWNKDGMHHIDPHHTDGHDWIACVDGHFRRFKLHTY